MATQWLNAALFMLPIVAFGGTDVEAAAQTDLCELVKSPIAFNGRLVNVRAPVQIAFENFGLSVDQCPDKKLDFVWLEYGRGPKRQPTIWCCGDLVPRDALTLTQDAEFRRSHRLLTAEQKAERCYNCYLYRVTATINGRFDAMETVPCPGNPARRCCSSAFGHFGMACGRIVIRKVTAVAATPIDQKVQDRKK